MAPLIPDHDISPGFFLGGFPVIESVQKHRTIEFLSIFLEFFGNFLELLGKFVRFLIKFIEFSMKICV